MLPVPLEDLPTFDEWYDSVSGFASEHGDPDAAEIMMDAFSRRDWDRGLHLYKRFKSWSSHVPFKVIKTAFGALSIGDPHGIFDMVFVKEDTHIQVQAMEQYMRMVQRSKPWLNWMSLVDWKQLKADGNDRLINPKFLVGLYKYDPRKEQEWEDSFKVSRD